MIAVANATIERALRVVSVTRGHDVRQFALVAFGGAGGLHVAEVGRALGVREVLVPRRAGVLSAWGLLGADVVHPLSRTVLRELDAAALNAATKIFDELERSASKLWGRGFRFRRSADLRYHGQSFEIDVPWSRRLAADFHRAHLQRYGYDRSSQRIEIVNLNLEARKSGLRLPVPKLVRAHAKPRRRWITLDADGTLCKASVHERDDLNAGSRIRGPALIVEYGATTYLPPGHTLTVDRQANLRITS